MGDTLKLLRPLCNGSVRVESRAEKLTGAAGFLLLREALGRTALIEPLAAQLEDPRDPRRVTHSLTSLLRASVAMIAQGWGDQSDALRLHDDPVLAITANDRAGVRAPGGASGWSGSRSTSTVCRCRYMVNSRAPRTTGTFGNASTIR